MYHFLAKVFPKQTKCLYIRFGPSGAIDSFDFLCTMAMNNFHDKFFLLYWFWCVLQIVLFTGYILYLMQFLLPYMRYRSIRQLVAFEMDTKNIFKLDLKEFVYQISIPDFFFLYHVRGFLFVRVAH